ncbi:MULTISPECIES: TniB family NTP-binding protein [Kitasatospora]|nr:MULTISPECIES: TniB family NTP-binding protein [Kitasatospora]
MHPGLAEPRTKEEWRAYVDHTAPPRPELPPYSTYEAMTPDERDDFNDARDDHHSALALVRTSRMQEIHQAIDQRIRVNRHQAAGARRGIVIDGPPTIGKSTAVKWFAADFERRLRRRHPERFEPGYVVDGYIVDYCPVVYLSVPAAATPKDLSSSLAHYLAIPNPTRGTKSSITSRVLDVMRLCGTELVIIDDAHFLDLSAREGRIVNDHLKDIANHVAATFVYTGVDLKKSGLFLEGRGASVRATQTSGRNTLHSMSPFKINTTAEKTEWVKIVLALESALCLYQHEAGSLAKLAQYLHDRTSGSICALSDLLRESAIVAVHTGEEKITRPLMETVEISDLAQSAYRVTVKAKKPGEAGSRSGSAAG